MHRIKANKRVLIGLIISILIILAVGYIYWLKAYVPSQNAATLTPTPTQSNNEIPFPTPIVISPIPTPTDIDSWQDSTKPYIAYQWTFKYPSDWYEYPLLKEFAYIPSGLEANQFNLHFLEIKSDWMTPELAARVTNVGNENTPVIKHEITTVNNRDIEIITSTEIEDKVITGLRIQSFIKDVAFVDGHNPGQCLEDRMLNIDAIYENPPFFTLDNIPYENDIKQMLTTLEITDCEPSN